MFLFLIAALLSPDPILTPGAIATMDVAKICRPGYTRTVRHTTRAMRLEVFARYGIAPSRNYEIDHLIPLELGGADVIENLWPQSYVTQPTNAHTKDVIENALHREVCAGRMTLQDAQSAVVQ